MVKAPILAAVRVKKSDGLFRIITYHHELIVKLREHGFDTFADPSVCP